MSRRQLSYLELWMLWLAANVMPWWMGCALLHPLGTVTAGIELPVVVGAWGITCALVGIAQWWVLRQRLPGMKWWPVATVLGGAIAFLGFFASERYSTPMVVKIDRFPIFDNNNLD